MYLINRLREALKQSSSLESKTQGLGKINKMLASKNTFLQDELLILKEKYQALRTQKPASSASQALHPPKTPHADTLKQQKQTIETLQKIIKNSENINWKLLKQQKTEQKKKTPDLTGKKLYLLQIYPLKIKME